MVKKHLKRLFAPKDWMLSKLTGVFAPRPRAGPHKLRECLPLLVIIRNRLKYALNAKEGEMILRQGLVNVDGHPRRDGKYPAGFMDVVEIPKTGDRFRILYDAKGRFSLVNVSEAEGSIKLLKVTNLYTATGRVPVAVTHDGHRIRYPELHTAIGDTIVYNIKEKKPVSLIKARAGCAAMITGGANRGRIGQVVSIERHPGALNIVHLKDAEDNEFATRATNLFVIGKDLSSLHVTVPKRKGVRMNVIQEREEKLIAAEARKSAQKSRKARK
ncbi:small subunit ribosomal protein S4e [Angomonas deanei]|uniref:40S ribosomal protein S4 n=1 Tax=Angomonas deanei TaxID=59799 RepID=S9UJI1_9TRYP|nr:small subunit ribosomal protein S4e [Angomonas deanei]EPY28929.1 small subunit ribosomal protein S4e [Angomonas deanei]EPY32259.1 small subunit ribosomal protein S4e [Angomonas deanei]EPY41331.1 small subunit ribosomal protein S4e [Angomonas deanei]EPY41550.1 small subunit ribosomal protein S4e [Angomonas deanei]|eukprot:EPY26751.1 small subunit ribosomal protein S4e [Angomonas deanei]